MSYARDFKNFIKKYKKLEEQDNSAIDLEINRQAISIKNEMNEIDLKIVDLKKSINELETRKAELQSKLNSIISQQNR